MARLTNTAAAIFVILIIVFIAQAEKPAPSIQEPTQVLKVGSYNMQVFGMDKASNPDLMTKYQMLIKNYDLFFVQEIRDSSGLAFKALCDSLPEYQCFISSRAGRTSSKEQYGVLYKGINLSEIYDYNLYNYSERYERPPLRINMEYLNNTLTFFLIHVKPDDAQLEIDNLEQDVISYNQPYTIVLGDLNMDCSYYNGTNFVAYKFVIDSNMDTTTGNTNCAYDRIIMSPQAYLLVQSSGIDLSVTAEMSDHFPVFFSF